MAGYRRVNYYELCRLCTSSEGTKMHIFREEGRRRSLPSKIQTCLPLQVQEEDSLPKIICSSCVEKLESYFEFRESCINAEAMLESYFTSLKYSDDLRREGKVSVYVKDEPPKKKDDSASAKVKIPVSTVNSVTSVGEGNGILPPAIQILTEADGNRLTQYKVQVQAGLPSLIPYSGEQTSMPLSVSLPALTGPSVKEQSTSTSNTSVLRADDGTQTTNESSTAPPPPPLVAAVAITPQNHEFFQQMGLTPKDRNSVADVLKLKNINILESGSCESVAVSAPQIIASPLAGQLPGLIPAQIRLDHNQLNQLISSNLQINLSHLQSSQKSDTSQNKNASAVSETNESQVKDDTSSKKKEEKKKESEEKRSETKVNGNRERSNSPNEKSKAKVSKESKSEEDSKFEAASLETDPNVEDGEDSKDGEDQKYDCETCTKKFKRKEHLFQHKKSHSGERPFVCNICSKAFSRKEHLLRHAVSHTGQKLYACEVCQKSFSRKDNLHKHRKTHGINGPYVCDTCGKSFVVKHYYVIHKAQHENLPNTENSTGVAVKHLISTNSTINPLPFKCDLCTKSFSIKSYLTSHRLRHRSKVKRGAEDCKQERNQEDRQQSQEQQTSSDIAIPQPAILTGFPSAAANINLATLNTQLTTINPNALLAPNILHHAGANVVHIGNNSYLCTPTVTPDLLEQYRRIHSS